MSSGLEQILIIIAVAVGVLVVSRVVQVEVWRRGLRREFIQGMEPAELVPQHEEGAPERLGGRGLVPRLLDELHRAGWKIRPSDFAAVMALCSAAGLVIGYFITKSAYLGAAFALVFATFPWGVMKWLQQKRVAAFSAQLPEALFLIASAVRTGFSFTRAMEVAAKEMGDPLREEFEQVLTDCRVGIPEVEALQRLRGRIGLPEIDLISTGVALNLQVGGNLSRILDTLANTVRERFRIAGEIKAVTAEGRLSATILVAAPLVLLMILSLVNPGYMHPLIREPLGHKLLALMLLSEAVGVLLIRWLLRRQFQQM